VSPISTSIPRAFALDAFRQDPLCFLARQRSRHGDAVVIHERGPMFSGSPSCVGAVAVFGPAWHRALLEDSELLGMPTWGTLGTHAICRFRDESRCRHSRGLACVIEGHDPAEAPRAIRAATGAITKNWRPGQRLSLLSEMRRLAHSASCALLFGERDAEVMTLGARLAACFQGHGEAASLTPNSAAALRSEAETLGGAGRALRHYLRERPAQPVRGLLARRAQHPDEPPLAEDELIAHANTLFAACADPIAVALTWTLLLLSQLPKLRRALRCEPEPYRETGESECTALLDSVIQESLRVLPPHAVVVRVTTRPVSVLGVELPPRCELILCPFLAHRDPDPFPRPQTFLPHRWSTARPQPFAYLPFGTGSHECVGSLAMRSLRIALSYLLHRHDLVLPGDQLLDWQLRGMLLPRTEPSVEVRRIGAEPRAAGRLLGPVRNLFALDGSGDAL